jgi:hypothetical protein
MRTELPVQRMNAPPVRAYAIGLVGKTESTPFGFCDCKVMDGLSQSLPGCTAAEAEIVISLVHGLRCQQGVPCRPGRTLRAT